MHPDRNLVPSARRSPARAQRAARRRVRAAPQGFTTGLNRPPAERPRSRSFVSSRYVPVACRIARTTRRHAARRIRHRRAGRRAYGWDELSISANSTSPIPTVWTGPGTSTAIVAADRARRTSTKSAHQPRSSPNHPRRPVCGCPAQSTDRRARASGSEGQGRRASRDVLGSHADKNVPPRPVEPSVTSVVRLSGKCNSEACQTRMSSPTRSRRWRTTTPPRRRC